MATSEQEVNLEGLEFASPDSAAEKYVRIQENQDRANEESWTLDLFQDSGRVELCQPGGSPGDEECVLFSDFEFEGTKLSNFSVENMPIEGRMALGDGTGVPIIDGGSVTLLSAFEASNGFLILAVLFSSPSLMSVPVDEVLYLPSTGAESESVTQAVRPDDWRGRWYIRAGVPTAVLYGFEGKKLGGQLTLDFEGAETVVVDIPTQ
jgi:hypothetical protein